MHQRLTIIAVIVALTIPLLSAACTEGSQHIERIPTDAEREQREARAEQLRDQLDNASHSASGRDWGPAFFDLPTGIYVCSAHIDPPRPFLYFRVLQFDRGDTRILVDELPESEAAFSFSLELRDDSEDFAGRAWLSVEATGDWRISCE